VTHTETANCETLLSRSAAAVEKQKEEKNLTRRGHAQLADTLLPLVRELLAYRENTWRFADELAVAAAK